VPRHLHCAALISCAQVMKEIQSLNGFDELKPLRL
jgi:hypothetical protein